MVSLQGSISLTFLTFAVHIIGFPNPPPNSRLLLSSNSVNRNAVVLVNSSHYVPSAFNFVDEFLNNTNLLINELSRNRITDISEAQFSSSGCSKCKRDLKDPEAVDEDINEKVMRSIRLELIKIQILAKLNLTEPPKEDKKRKHIPSLIQEGLVPGANLDNFPVPSQIFSPPIIFVADARVSCPSVIKSPSSCFKFDFTGESNGNLPSVLEAILWFYKLPDKSDGAPQMITVSQLWKDGNNGKSGHELLISHLITNVTEGWISVNVSWSYSSKAAVSISPLQIRIACTTCIGGARHRHPVSGSVNHRPFLVMQGSLTTKDDKLRTKRSTKECTTSNQGCCRSSIYVDFAELGWSDWIYQPKGFTMYYCRGSCRNVSPDSVNSAGHTYTGLLRRLLLRPNLPSSLKDDLAPCCTPGHKEPISLLCRTGPGSSAISVRVLQDMIVESCNCYD